MFKKVMLVILVALPLLLPGPNLWADDDSIMDVDDNAASLMPAAAWSSSTYRILYYGDDYAYVTGSGSSTATARAAFITAQTADISGYYQVYVRWTAGTARATNAYYRIEDDTGTFKGSCTKDQRYNGGAWQFCDDVYLDQGRKGVVVLRNANVPTNRYICADAIRFVRVSKDKNDIVDMPGIEFDTNTVTVRIYSTDPSNPIILQGEKAITCPSGGFVVAEGFGSARLYTAVTYEWFIPYVRISLTTGISSDSSNEVTYGVRLGPGVSVNSLIGYSPIHVARVDTCSAGQSIFYRLVAWRNTYATDSTAVVNPKLILRYYPERY